MSSANWHLFRLGLNELICNMASEITLWELLPHLAMANGLTLLPQDKIQQNDN